MDNLGNFYVGEDCGVAEVTNGTSEAIYRGAPTDSYSTVPVAVGAGNVYFGSTQYYTVWKVPVGSPSTSSGVPVAGNGTPGCSNGYIKQPYGLAVDLNGNLYIADQSCNVIWQVTPSGAVSSNAGTVGSNGAAQKGFSEPEGVAVDLYGNVYVADWGNCLVREIVAPWQPSAQTVTIAGNGSCGPSASTSVGPALDVPVQPYGITVGPGGVIFFTDQQDNSENYVRMLMPQGSQLTSPAPGSTLTSNNVTFQWTGTPGATGYSLTLGSQPRASDLYSNSSIAGSATSITVDGLVVNGQTIYADLQTQVDTWLPDPGPVVYHAATELTLTLTPSSVAPAGAFTATVGVGYAVEGPAFTLSVTITYPQTCRSVILDGRKFPMCTPGITAPLFSESSFAIEPDCLGGLFHVCLDLPISYSESLMAPSEAGTYSITATLTPVGSSTPVATVTEPFIVK